MDICCNKYYSIISPAILSFLHFILLLYLLSDRSEADVLSDIIIIDVDNRQCWWITIISTENDGKSSDSR